MTHLTAALLAALLALGLPACSSPHPPVLYSLRPANAPAPHPAAAQAHILVHAMPTRVPDALDRTDILLRSGNAHTVRVPGALWQSQFAHEVHAAVLGAILHDGRIAPAPPSAMRTPTTAHYTLALSVERLDVALGQFIQLDVSWSLHPPTTPTSPAHTAAPSPITCRASWHTPLPTPDLTTAITTQQTLMTQWGQRIQRQLHKLSGLTDATTACGAL